MEMNGFADMENSEFRQKYFGYRSQTKISSTVFTPAFSANLPNSTDWRTQGISTEIKNQGSCGSCWAFSAVAAIESAYNIAHNGSSSMDKACVSSCGPNNNRCCTFSEQEIVDCTLKGADTCAKGGEPHDGVVEIVKNHGGKINTEQQYPYTSGGGKSGGVCNAKDSVAIDTGLTGYANVSGSGSIAPPYGNETALAYAVWQKGVISIGIDASSTGFQMYKKGVYNNLKCKKRQDLLDHGVAIVGYGTSARGIVSKGKDYWLVKNSWGVSCSCIQVGALAAFAPLSLSSNIHSLHLLLCRCPLILLVFPSVFCVVVLECRATSG
jgi:hypothetical protein